MDKNEMMIVCEVAKPELRDKLLELYKRDKPQNPIRVDMCTCPKCGTHNEVVSKRRNTVFSDIVYCWHCGQAITVSKLN